MLLDVQSDYTNLLIIYMTIKDHVVELDLHNSLAHHDKVIYRFEFTHPLLTSLITVAYILSLLFEIRKRILILIVLGCWFGLCLLTATIAAFFFVQALNFLIK